MRQLSLMLLFLSVLVAVDFLIEDDAVIVFMFNCRHRFCCSCSDDENNNKKLNDCKDDGNYIDDDHYHHRQSGSGGGDCCVFLYSLQGKYF